MKKIISITLIFALCLCLCACGGNNLTSPNESNKNDTFLNSDDPNKPTVMNMFYRNTLGIEIVSDNTDIQAVDQKADKLLKKIEDYPDSLKASGKTYYVSAEGDDKNDGLTPETAVNSYLVIKNLVTNGDVVLFRRGDIFRGQIRLMPGVSYGAYGTGIKPRIYGSSDGKEGTWTETEKDIYTYNAPMNNYSNIVFNNGEAVGRPVQNSEELTKKALNVLYKAGKISVYSPDGNPAEIFDNIEIVDDAYCLVAGNGNGEDSRDITLQNLCIMYTGVHCIGGLGSAFNFTIEGCVLGFAGGRDLYKGGTQKSLGNAIEFWYEAENVNVHDNYIFQCYDTGITHQGPNSKFNNIRYSNNLIEYCVWGIEAWTSHGKDQEGPNNTYGDVYIENNIIRHSGYGWGSLDRPDKDVYCDIIYNVKDHVKPLTISGNILDRTRKNSIFFAKYPDKSLQILTDNTFLIEGNSGTAAINMNGQICKIGDDFDTFANKFFGTVSGNKLINVE